MLKHCTLYDEWMLGKNKPVYKQVFMGRLFGKTALKDFVRDDKSAGQLFLTAAFNYKFSFSYGRTVGQYPAFGNAKPCLQAFRQSVARTTSKSILNTNNYILDTTKFYKLITFALHN